MSKKVEVLGYNTSASGVLGSVEEGLEYIKQKKSGHYMACINPHSVVVARNDRDFQAALHDADILLPDGAGIVLASKILGLGIKNRVAGSDYFHELSRRANLEGNIKYYFLGSTEAVLNKINERMKIDYPNIEVCGMFSPPFKDVLSSEDNMDIISQINEAAPDVLWVGMTAPKQEKWIHQNIEKLNVQLIGAIGAVFDFYAGTKKRAPEWVCQLGLEWLPRLIREPKRLFKRNFVSSPLFLLMVFKEKINGSRGK